MELKHFQVIFLIIRVFLCEFCSDLTGNKLDLNIQCHVLVHQDLCIVCFTLCLKKQKNKTKQKQKKKKS